MLNKIKKDINDAINKRILIKINNARSKSDSIYCNLVETYDKHFIVMGDDLVKRSFSYVDILIGNIEITIF